MSKTCTRCGRTGSFRTRRGRCPACYHHLYMYGRERPQSLIDRYRERRNICDCGESTYALGLCQACYAYQHQNGKPRPKRLWNRPKRCVNPNCKKPLAGLRAINYLCPACYTYHRRKGEDRPRRLTKTNEWCECGKPVTHVIDILVGGGGKSVLLKKEKLKLCDECYEYERKAA